MNKITLDFETYWGDDHSLSKLNELDYVMGEKYQTIMLGYRYGSGNEPGWAPSNSKAFEILIDNLIKTQNDSIAVAHNMQFDGSILSWRYGYEPRYLACTLAMARSLGLQKSVGGSLGKLIATAQQAGITIPTKGDDVASAKNLRLENFKADHLKSYGDYCMDDVRATCILFDEFAKLLTPEELVWQSVVHKMHCYPLLRINAGVVEAELVRVREHRAQAMQRLVSALGLPNADGLMTIINSNPKLAEAIQLFGGEPPTKISEKTSKEAWAFDNKTPEFLDMRNHPIPEVAELVTARLGLRGSIAESRCISMLALAKYPVMPATYQVSKARTHRLGGGDGDGDGEEANDSEGSINLQNLPSGRIQGQSKALRTSIEPALDGYVLVGSDSSQIEVRTIDTIANDTVAMDNHRKGVCPYSVVAVQLFNEGTPEQIKADAKKGIEPWAMRRQIAKSARLALQFGQGGPGYSAYAFTSAGLRISVEDATVYAKTYRANNPSITKLWRDCGKVLEALVRGERGYFGGPSGHMFYYDGSRTVLGVPLPGIRLPDGMWLSYHDIRVEEGKYGKGYVFTEYKGRKRENHWLHGAKLAQQLTQATAFAVMKWYAVQIDTHTNWRLVLNSHDEHVLCVPEHEAPAAKAYLEQLMTTVPDWAEGMPVACEAHIGRNYGELK